MRLRIITPLAVVVDEDGVLALRAEDASGSFGILPGHADFLTSLAISVVELGEHRRDAAIIARCGAACSPSPVGGTSPSRPARR